MFATFCRNKKAKGEVRKLLQTCGYGIADLDRAQFCMENSVNMIIEGEIQPFKSNNNTIVFDQMNVHKLPWPKDYLLEMGTADVEMRVVLSYFVEPSPGEKGWDNKYCYPSCGLRFDVNNPEESEEQFKQRISKEMNDESKVDTVNNDTTRWLIGAQSRSTGSLHCDIWKGSAAQLSESNLIIVYPTTGWWKTRPHLHKYDSLLRYSLVVTLSTPKIDAQLYTQILTEIKEQVAIHIENKI